jgi:hypothetical protein
MSLSRLEFLVLNNLADDAEPFSMLYIDILGDLRLRDTEAETGFEDVAAAVAGLCELGLVRPVNGATDDPDVIADHYVALDEELVEFLEDELITELEFQYSRGEWAYAMTPAGESEWQNPAYAQFYPDDE